MISNIQIKHFWENYKMIIHLKMQDSKVIDTLNKRKKIEIKMIKYSILN